MKNILLIVAFLIFTPLAVKAQEGDRIEKIKALKTAYITKELDLTAKEAEKFWPIYNEYSKKIDQLRFTDTKRLFHKIKDAGGVDNLTDKEAAAIVSELAQIDLNMAKEKEKLYKNLNGVISSKKILKLIRAENGFGKELLKKFRENRRGGNFEEN